MRLSRIAVVAAALFALPVAFVRPVTAQDTIQDAADKFSQNEVVQAASGFFGTTTEAAAKAVQRVFADQGLPDAYIKGDEGSGAVVVGLRYGSGWLIRKHAAPMRVYWQGPSVGFDFGGNASKVFVLIYNLGDSDRLFQKFPGWKAATISSPASA